MNRPTPHAVAVIASTITVASLVMAMTTGTGPDTGVFLLISVISLAVATLAWNAARSTDRPGSRPANRWRTLLLVGAGLLAGVLVIINVPPYNHKDLPGAGWVVMMLSLVTSIALITVGLTIGIAQRSTRRTTTL